MSMPESDKKPPKSKAHKIAAMVSTIMWVVGFALPFMLPPNSNLIWVSDTLLLLGFWPLLYIWKAGWPSFVFGVLNIGIGFLLEVSFYLPSHLFTQEMLAVRQHLMDQHYPLSWILIGAISAVFGLVRMIRTIARFFIGPANREAAGAQEGEASTRLNLD